MRYIICDMINLLHLHPEVLSLSEEMHRFPPKTTNQRKEEGLSAVNQPRVRTAECANGGEATHHYRKPVIRHHRWACKQALAVALATGYASREQGGRG